jgi:hypothetical protein
MLTALIPAFSPGEKEKLSSIAGFAMPFWLSPADVRLQKAFHRKQPGKNIRFGRSQISGRNGTGGRLQFRRPAFAELFLI